MATKLEQQLDRALKVLNAQTRPRVHIVRPPRPRGGKKRMGSQTFDQLAVGEIFKFAAEDKYTSAARGPWVKLSARTYRHIEGDWSPVIRVGSIRVLVRRVPEWVTAPHGGNLRPAGKGR